MLERLQEEKLGGIALTRIFGLNEEPVWWDHGDLQDDYYFWPIQFSGAPNCNFHKRPFIIVGNDYEDRMRAVMLCILYRKNFRKAQIFDGGSVIVVYDTGGIVKLVGSPESNMWIDLYNKFTPKAFHEFDISRFHFR